MDTSGEKMTATWSPSEALPRGVVQEFNTIFYEKGASCELELRDMSTPTFQVFAKSDEIKVMSFNVRTTLTESNTANNWDNRKGACVALIKEHMPSFIGVQEAKYNAHWTYLKQELSADYDGYGVNRDTGKESGSGETMGILYNKRVVEMIDCGTFWLSETPEVPSKGWGANHYRSATWGLFKHRATGKKICYINTHIDHQSAEAKVEGMKLVSRFFQQYRKEDYLLFLTADFNMGSTHEAMDVIESYMHNTREVAPEALTDNDRTYNGFNESTYSIIDHIYCSNYLKVVEYHTIDEDYGVPFVSDHYPIYSIIKIE
jgi:endonuclease/exonuclease/phosphatase family metal-dependent hydrolase